MFEKSEVDETCARMFEEGVVREYRDEFHMKDWQAKVKKRLTRDIPENLQKISALERYMPDPQANWKVLSVGCGWGGFPIACAKRGHEAFGIDPDEQHIMIARWRANKEGVKAQFDKGIGEHLPYPDNTFDLVDCHSVLEHVQDPEKVIAEMIRVVRPDGRIHVNAPNHLYPAEPHYQMICPPFALTPKIIMKLYLKLSGRDTKIADTLTPITPYLIRKAIKDIKRNGVILIVQVGQDGTGDVSGHYGLDYLYFDYLYFIGYPSLEIPTLTWSNLKKLCWNILDSIYHTLGVGGTIHVLLIKEKETIKTIESEHFKAEIYEGGASYMEVKNEDFQRKDLNKFLDNMG